MVIFQNNQFSLNLSQRDVHVSKIIDSFLRNSVPTILHVITQRIGICLNAYDRTLSYVKTIYVHFIFDFHHSLRI
jgi:hypothetical protein